MIFDDGTEAPPQQREIEEASKAGAQKVLGSRTQLVKEVVNEVLLRLEKERKKGKVIVNPPGWAWQVAVNYARRMLRKEQRYVGIDNDSDSIPDLSLTSLDQLIIKEKLTAISELVVLVAHVVETLSVSDRELYNLYFRQEYRFDQIAEALGVEIPTVRKRWYRLIKKISEEVRSKVSADTKLSVVFARIVTDKCEFRNSLTRLLAAISREGLSSFQKTLANILRN